MNLMLLLEMASDAMGDRVAILKDGRLVQYDRPEQILASPANDFVADFVGASERR